MGVSLGKSGSVSLTKQAPGLTTILIGGAGTVLSDAHFVFNNLASPDGSVEHTGDNRTGEGEGDHEQVRVELPAVPPGVDRVVFPVSIYDADSRGQSSWPDAQRRHPSRRPGRRRQARALRPVRGRRKHRGGTDVGVNVG